MNFQFNNFQKIFIFSIIFFGVFGLAESSQAACSGSSPNLTAASANMADVVDCVTMSTYGDTINIPACAAGACVYTGTGIAITKDIRLVGAGIDSTILTLGFTASSSDIACFNFIPDATSRSNLQSLSGTHTFEVTGITFAGDNRMTYKYGTYINTTSRPAIKRVNIHHNKYTNVHRATETRGYTYGVFHHNILINTNATYPRGAGIDEFLYNERTAGSENNFYIEDNTLSFTTVGEVSGAANEGGGYVARYNTVTGSSDMFYDIHSNQGSGIKGGQTVEIYGNDLGATTAQNGFAIRGGKEIIFNNKVVDSSGHLLKIYEEYADSFSGTLPANQCPSDGPQVCLDSCICWKLNHSYIWNNRHYTTNVVIPPFIDADKYDGLAGSGGGTDNNPPELAENREFWAQRPTGTFDGTGGASAGGGVGCGTLASRPATCTTGVGYWATEQSCSDFTGMIGANPSTPISGTLYKCTASNTWTVYYTPYTYPHPLTLSSDITPPAAPSGLSVN